MQGTRPDSSGDAHRSVLRLMLLCCRLLSVLWHRFSVALLLSSPSARHVDRSAHHRQATEGHDTADRQSNNTAACSRAIRRRATLGRIVRTAADLPQALLLDGIARCCAVPCQPDAHCGTCCLSPATESNLPSPAERQSHRRGSTAERAQMPVSIAALKLTLSHVLCLLLSFSSPESSRAADALREHLAADGRRHHRPSRHKRTHARRSLSVRCSG